MFGNAQNRYIIQWPIWLLSIFLFFHCLDVLSRELGLDIFPPDIQLVKGSQQRVLVSQSSESGFIKDLSRNA